MNADLNGCMNKFWEQTLSRVGANVRENESRIEIPRNDSKKTKIVNIF